MGLQAPCAPLLIPCALPLRSSCVGLPSMWISATHASLKHLAVIRAREWQRAVAGSTLLEFRDALI